MCDTYAVTLSYNGDRTRLLIHQELFLQLSPEVSSMFRPNSKMNHIDVPG